MALTRAEARLTGAPFIDQVDALVESWEVAQNRLTALAADPTLLVLTGGGAANFENAVIRSRELMREVDAELRLLRARTVEWAGVTTAEQVGQGATLALESATGQGATGGASGSLGTANTRTIAVISDEILIDADFASSSARRTMQRHFRQTQQLLVEESAINTQLLVSQTRLENLNQRTKRLTKLFEQAAGKGRFVLVNGRRFEMTTYARIVAKTRLAEAASEGALNGIKALGIDTTQVSDHGPTDARCDAFAGKVFSISGRTRRFPPLRERPPFHPGCKHIMLPFVAELKTERELAFAEARNADRIPPGTSILEFERAVA